MQSVADELEEKTKQYWIISSVWNQRLDFRYSTENAIQDCVNLESLTSPHRPLHFRSARLLEEIIEGESPKSEGSAKLLEFPDSADIQASV
jgi:hypothetical protein